MRGARSVKTRLWAAFSALGGTFLLAAEALAQPTSPFDPASPQARAVSDLFWIIIAISALIFLLVEGLLLYMIFRFRGREGEPDPRPIFGQRTLEIGWTVAPAVVLVIVFALMLPLMLSAAAPPANAVRVTAIGHQWWWEFRYPDLNVVTANELHVPVGQPVRVQLESADVIHSLWLPRLSGKTDLIPGKRNELWFAAQAADTYLGQCAEFCGIQHAWMLVRVVAQAPNDFNAWVTAQQQGAGATAAGAARQGEQVFFGNTCVNCHTIQGTPATGTVGPDLTHIGSRQTIGAGVLQNTPANMQAWLKDPQAFKPGSLMPDFHLSDQDVSALAAYLEGLK
jgi:cytochrome c oxidase subunit 2